MSFIINYHANDEWHWIIGAAHTGWYSYYTGRKVYACDNEPDPQVRALCENECQDPDNYDRCYYDEVINVFGTIHDPSDGVVPLPAQEALPGKLGWTKTAGLPPFGDDPTGCGHQEARNHAGMTDALTRVFNGEPHPVFQR